MASSSEQGIAPLVQAASDARAASDAVVALGDHQSSKASLGGGFHEAGKLVRQPAPFGSESHEDDLSRWQDFNVSCKAWLFYGNKSYELDHRVEVTHAETPIANMDGEPQDVKDRCNQLYSILTGLLKGKPLHRPRQVGNRNGLRRQWCQLYMPRTRSCAIYLVSVPSFTTRDRTLLGWSACVQNMFAPAEQTYPTTSCCQCLFAFCRRQSSSMCNCNSMSHRPTIRSELWW